VVNIHITGSSPSGSIIWADPSSTGSSTGAGSHYVGAITLENCLSCIASARDYDPLDKIKVSIAYLESFNVLQFAGHPEGGKFDAGYLPEAFRKMRGR
jgi:hypothetical protein